VPLLLRSNDHHRDVPERRLAALSSRGIPRRVQVRHIMISSGSRQHSSAAVLLRRLSTDDDHARPRPTRTVISSFNLRHLTPVLPIAIDRPSSSPPQPLPKQAVNARRLQIAAAEIPMASDALPRHISRGFLVWGFFCRSSQCGKSFVFRQFSLFDLKVRFFVPTRGSLTSSRAGAVKVGRRANLAACSELARPYLDSFEHDGTLGAIGMTIRGEPAFGRGSVAPQPCIR
jgi:hypothetical protein